MADPKDTSSFFLKVVKFVANPSTEWNELDSGGAGTRESEFAKHELKAMIERKRRNDFVRKREFDMLRKVRREGLSGDQLAALGGSSRLDDSEVRAESGAKPDSGVKAKIDEIEQQMVGDNQLNSRRRTPEFYNAPTQPAPLDTTAAGKPPAARAALRPEANAEAAPVPSKNGNASAAPHMHAFPMDTAAASFSNPLAMEVSEVVHDPELDEAVISFANADFESCEQSLNTLIEGQGRRVDHAETWLVLFDLYRAIGQQPKFDSLAMDYVQRFGWSPPQWFSMPKMVANTTSSHPQVPKSSADMNGQVGWACPEHIDAEAVNKLRSQSLQMPLPWVFDWSALKTLDVEASVLMSDLFRSWMPQKLDLRWLGGDRLFAVLQEAAPTGVRDADPAYWQLRLDGLRMANRADQFDEAAIDYCVTYEVSPPSWEPTTCQVRISGSGQSTNSPSMSLVSEVSTSFMESQILEDQDMVQVASMELSGQLVGDIDQILVRLTAKLGSSSVVNVSCTKLIRVDFIAAGDLLNWVLARRSENRAITFTDTHRLVALFFGAMGINEHAKVKVHTV
ncbi:MAG: hypothetical protein HEQ39_03255 [Rhizobacter sp.]